MVYATESAPIQSPSIQFPSILGHLGVFLGSTTMIKIVHFLELVIDLIENEVARIPFDMILKCIKFQMTVSNGLHTFF